MTPAAPMSVPRRMRPETYEDLPDPVRLVVSRTEWLWLPAPDKARLITDLCTPDWSD